MQGYFKLIAVSPVGKATDLVLLFQRGSHFPSFAQLHTVAHLHFTMKSIRFLFQISDFGCMNQWGPLG